MAAAETVSCGIIIAIFSTGPSSSPLPFLQITHICKQSSSGLLLRLSSLKESFLKDETCGLTSYFLFFFLWKHLSHTCKGNGTQEGANAMSGTVSSLSQLAGQMFMRSDKQQSQLMG